MHDVKIPDGIRANERFGVAFLRNPSDGFVTAEAAFDSLSEDGKNFVRKSFDMWMGGIKTAKTKRRYHGFDASDWKGSYQGCFVFKWPVTDLHLYGFLCHPDPDRPRFVACVLVHATTKPRWATSPTILDAVLERAKMQGVKDATTRCFAPAAAQRQRAGAGARGVTIGSRRSRER